MGNLISKWKRNGEFSLFKKRDKISTIDDLNCIYVQKCCICLTKISNAVVYKCGHICMCFVCARIVRKEYKKCPICKKKILDILRFYT